MPRARPIFPVALSIQSASDALDIPRRVVAEAVTLGDLAAYSGPGKRIRILVPDLVAWVKSSWPRRTKRSEK